MRWDLFCTVVDNFGDIGVCWRLARQLSSEYGVQIRLWVDNLERLACLCPQVSVEVDQQTAEGIDIRLWTAASSFVDIADVVIEAFACQLPQACIEAMIRHSPPPLWINLEYLTAEDWIEECHGLPSVQSRNSLKKTFFFPGFTARTGGLIRENDLLEQRNQFDRRRQARFWRELGIHELAEQVAKDHRDAVIADQHDLIISLFCYENPALRELLQIWSQSERPIRLMVTPGYANEQVATWLGEALRPGHSSQQNSLTVHPLPFLSQADYDRLLWCSDLNFVRGEDSFVRAQWAQQPFVWQIYPQSENAHLVKLDAFLARYLNGFRKSAAVHSFWFAWNGVGDVNLAWQAFVENLSSLRQRGKDWAAELDQLGHLADNLVRFVGGNQFTG